MTIATDQAFEQISEMISTRKPFGKRDIVKMVKHFSIEQIWILSGRLDFLKAKKKENYDQDIKDIRNGAICIGRSMSGFYDEDVSSQFIGFQERARKIDKIIDFLRQISEDFI